mmetsp:Transcript_46122/g.73907  ORF Transcript_46122/g.73907 Transcript_46122/m.73907 type:complete len:246 (+) Transcript_46122:133-870(+)
MEQMAKPLPKCSHQSNDGVNFAFQNATHRIQNDCDSALGSGSSGSSSVSARSLFFCSSTASALDCMAMVSSIFVMITLSDSVSATDELSASVAVISGLVAACSVSVIGAVSLSMMSAVGSADVVSTVSITVCSAVSAVESETSSSDDRFASVSVSGSGLGSGSGCVSGSGLFGLVIMPTPGITDTFFAFSSVSGSIGIPSSKCNSVSSNSTDSGAISISLASSASGLAMCSSSSSATVLLCVAST